MANRFDLGRMLAVVLFVGATGCANEAEQDTENPRTDEVKQRAVGSWSVFSTAGALPGSYSLWGRYNGSAPEVYSMGTVFISGSTACGYGKHLAGSTTSTAINPPGGAAASLCSRQFSGGNSSSYLDLFLAGGTKLLRSSVGSSSYSDLSASVLPADGGPGVAARSSGALDLFAVNGSSMYQVHQPVGGAAYLQSSFSAPTGKAYSYKQPAAIWSTVGGTQKLFILTPTTTDISVTRWSTSSPSWASTAGVLTSAPGSGVAMSQEGSSIGVSSLAYYAYVDTAGTVRWGYTPDAGANFYPSGSSGYSITAPSVGVDTIGGAYVTPAIVVEPGGSTVHIFVVGTNGNIYTYTL